MYVAFYDESGNDGRSAVFAMTGILMSHYTSYHFGNEWTELLGRFKVKEYHASDFHRREGEFDRWSDIQCNDFLESVVQLFLKWEIKHSGVAIVKDDYRRAFVDSRFCRQLRPAVKKWSKPYLYAFQHVVADLREYADHQPKGTYIAAVFDRCQEFMGQAQQDYAARNRDGKLGRMFVSNTREYIQLQAADFLVWEYRTVQEHLLQTENPDPGPTMTALLPHMFHAQTWSFAYLDDLRKRVEACIEGTDPETIDVRDPSKQGE